jgi:hypothetical protein
MKRRFTGVLVGEGEEGARLEALDEVDLGEHRVDALRAEAPAVDLDEGAELAVVGAAAGGLDGDLVEAADVADEVEARHRRLREVEFAARAVDPGEPAGAKILEEPRHESSPSPWATASACASASSGAPRRASADHRLHAAPANSEFVGALDLVRDAGEHHEVVGAVKSTGSAVPGSMKSSSMYSSSASAGTSRPP